MNLTAQAKSTGLQLVGKVTGSLGYIHGFRQPALTFKLQVGPPPTNEAIEQLDRLVRKQFGLGDSPINMPSGINPQIARLLFWSRAILQKNGQPVFEGAKAFRDPSDAPNIWTIAHPCLHFKACLGIVELSVSLMQLADPEIAASKTDLPSLVKARAKKYAALLDNCQVPGFNSIHFLTAATELGIPWSRISNVHFQFGHGASSRMLDSSFTDRTPQISTAIARDKTLASNLLRSTAIPVARHATAKSEDQAIEIAEELGFPVVVKPADKDGGIGVSAYLLDSAAVRRAFGKAKACSNAILVEKHFVGRDYRIQVVNGEVHGILDRAPGGVTGDGRHSVRDLVERQNQERANATDDRRHLHPIKFDEDAEAMLAHAGMDWSSTPPADQFVRLRGAANVASGGTPVPVPLDTAHPDNLDLALRAARVLRLDVAGIDMIAPDITKSWLETGAIICEVNSQPQMFTTMHKPMLESLLGGSDGRIPIVLILSLAPTEDVSPQLHELMRTAWPNTGMFNQQGIQIGTKTIINKTPKLFYEAQALMKDPAVEAVIVATHSDLLGTGWPFDRIDTLVVVGVEPDDAEAAKKKVLDMIEAANWLEPRHVLIDGNSQTLAAVQDQFRASELSEIIGAGCSPSDMGTMLANAAFASLKGSQAAPASNTTKKRRTSKPSKKA